MNFAEITDEVLKEAQELAHNAVRIVARLARQNAWEDYQTVKRWFEVKRKFERKKRKGEMERRHSHCQSYDNAIGRDVVEA